MSVYFFDSSALVKRYVKEDGTVWVQGITDPSAHNSIYVAEITGVEVVAAVRRKVRENSVSETDAATAAAQFRLDFANQYKVLELTGHIIARAMGLVEVHPLRAYDAVQLSAALEINVQSLSIGMPALGVPALIMVCSDGDLNAASIAEGLVVEDPRNYP